MSKTSSAKTLNPHFGVSEKQFETFVIQYLTLRGYLVWKNQSIGLFVDGGFRKTAGRAGVSDLTVISPIGIINYIELKKPAKFERSIEDLNKLLDPPQKLFKSDLEKFNVRFGVADSLAKILQILGAK